jgi:hypothetical protein
MFPIMTSHSGYLGVGTHMGIVSFQLNGPIPIINGHIPITNGPITITNCQIPILNGRPLFHGIFPGYFEGKLGFSLPLSF